MVQRFHHGDDGWRFVLRPNRSATWAQSKRFLIIVASVCLGIALAFTSIGFWPVLPFAGLEIALLTYALWWTSHRSNRTEVVDIDSDTVDIEKGHHAPDHHWTFRRAWARVLLVPARIRQHPSRLLIGSHGQHVHLGGFLTEPERVRLARDLNAALNGATSYPDANR